MQHCSAGRDRQGCWCVSVACNQLSPWQNLALYGCTSTISMIPEGNFRKRENLYFLKQQRQPCFPFAIWIYRAVPASVVFCCRICFSGAVTPNHPYFPLPSLTWCSLWSSLVAPYSIGSVRAGAEIFFFPFPTSLFFHLYAMLFLSSCRYTPHMHRLWCSCDPILIHVNSQVTIGFDMRSGFNLFSYLLVVGWLSGNASFC